MPHIVPRKVVPLKQEQPAEATKAPESISLDEVRALLDEQAAAFKRQIDTATQAFAQALKAVVQQPKDKPAQGWDFKVEYLNNGDIDTIRATPRAKAASA